MLAVRTILHPTDFSERSEYALGMACALTRDYGARLVILHVTHPHSFFAAEGVIPPIPEEIRAEALDRLNQLRVPQADVRAERLLEEGEPVTEILRVSRELPADLIVMGTHGRTGLGRVLMGSVAEQVVRRAACPVLTLTTPFRTAPVAATLTPVSSGAPNP